MVSSTSYFVRFFRCLRLALHLAWLGFGAAVIYRFVSQQRKLSLKKHWSRQILSILAIELDMEESQAPPGCLIVANHISWLDIFAINAMRPAAFIAKSEVRRWPFIGWLAACNETVFLHRGSRQHARAINAEIDALLNAGQDVAIFPEGRTGDGTYLREFHAALLQPAIETCCPIQPVAISYHDASGQRSLAPSFAGSVTLLQCFAAILSCPSLTARLVFLPEIATNGLSRRVASTIAHEAIATCLGLHPASTAPEIPPGPPA